MAKSVFTGDHQELVAVLKEARQRSGLRQTDLAERIGRDQAVVSLIEQSQRRVDVIEFIRLARAMGEDPIALFAEVVSRMPEGSN